MKDFIKGIIVAGAMLVSSATAWPAEYVLQSAHSGKFVTLHKGKLAAIAHHSRDGLKLEQVRLDNNRVAFRDVGRGNYIRAGVGQGTFMAPGSPHIRGWETFEMYSTGGGKLAFRSTLNGKYVRAGVGPDSLLAAVSDFASSWQEFRLIRIDQGAAPQTERFAELAEIVGHYRVTHVMSRDHQVQPTPPHLASAARLNINRDGSLSATTGCNRVSAQLAVHNGDVTEAGPTTITRAGCSDRVQLNFEVDIARALGDSRLVLINSRHTTFKDINGTILLRLSRL